MNVGPETLEFLRQQSFAVLCLELELGRGPEAVVVVKSTGDVVGSLRERRAKVAAGWTVHGTAHGPVVSLVVRAGDDRVGELAGEVYFDVGSDEDQALLQRLAGQEVLRFAFLSEDLEPVWLAETAWDEVRRLETEQVTDRAEELLERTEDYDFEKAKTLFQEAFPLDRLLERVLPR